MEKTGLLSTWQDPGVAVVTGASSGIGEEFARQLAALHFTPVLVARREDRLNALAEELQQADEVNPEVLVADLATSEGIEHVETRIREIENLDVLVNNAGFGTIGNFGEVDFKQQLDMLSVHVIAPVHFCRAAIEKMSLRKRGAIINVSSLGAFIFRPERVMYGSTKAFLKAFSENLALDVRGSKVKVQALCPGYVHTEFRLVGDYLTKEDWAVKLPEEMWMTAEDCVAQSLANLGHGGVIFVPGDQNRELLAKAGIKIR